ncbi:MAG: aminomethyl-transferring glycine dehydrogenase subunit GcvPB, partial [Solirubrobacterales bacterium]
MAETPTISGNRALQLEEPLIFDMGTDGRAGVDLPEPEAPLEDRLGALRRSAPIGLPNLSEPQVVRHYTRLSQKNYGI